MATSYEVVALATTSYDVPAAATGNASTELARRAVAVAEERSSQPDGPATGVTTRSGNSANARTWASRGETRSRGDGRGGTGLPETMSAIAMCTGSPPAVGATTQTPSPHARQTPSTSVIAGPPEGPVSPRSTRRTTTRVPTTWGPKDWAWADCDTRKD